MNRYHSQKSLNKRLQREKYARGDKKYNYDSKHPLDCGKTQCKVCHWDKYSKQKSYQDIKNELTGD